MSTENEKRDVTEEEMIGIVGCLAEGTRSSSVISGSKHYTCEKCNATIWLAPTGQHYVGELERDHKPYMILCTSCAMTGLPKEDVHVMELSDSQIFEILLQFAGSADAERSMGI